MTVTVESITARRRLLDISLEKLARAARLSYAAALRPGPKELGQLNRVLSIVEAGGCLDDARNTVGPTVKQDDGQITGQVTGQCFTDVPTSDGGGVFRHDRPPASLILRND